MNHGNRQKRFAWLVTALLLLSNALVTAHAFGEVDHAVKDGCQLLHQVERQQHAPASSAVEIVDVRRFAAPVEVAAPGRSCNPTRGFHSRAPPVA